MVLHFKDPELDNLVRTLAYEKRLSLTDAMKFAVRRALGEPDAVPPGLARAVDDMLLALAPFKEQMTRAGMKSQMANVNEGGNRYVRLAHGEIIESEEVTPGVVVDYGKDGCVIALEIDPDAVKCTMRAPLPRTRQSAYMDEPCGEPMRQP